MTNNSRSRKPRHRKQLRLLCCLLLCALALNCYGQPAVTKSSRPNVLLIVLDDLGYNDLGANGNPNTPTPNLDQFANEGIRYTRLYTDATCSPSRVALLTGRHPAHFGFRPAHLGLSKDTPTLARSLQSVGYLTQHIGKWHVGNATLDQSPKQAGFDHWFGFLTQFELKGLSSDGIHFQRPTYINPWLRGHEQDIKQYQGHLTDILTGNAIDFLNTQSGTEQNWFLNLWYYAPHNPIQPAQRFKKEFPDTDEGLYHALIAQLDSNVGKVLQTLEDNRQLDNTMVIILSDNGGTNTRTDNNYPFFGSKGYFFEGGVRTPLLIRWPNNISAGQVSDQLVTLYDIFPTITKASVATNPPELIGRNILGKNIPAPPQLYWEYSTSEYHNYSVLSADGRWRLVHEFKSEPVLNDLKTDPSGKRNILSQHPDIAAKLTEDYIQWRKAKRKVTTKTTTDIPHGGAKFEGNDILRSPGYGGFSFAIGVMPQEITDQPQVIVEQPGRWRLQHSSKYGLDLQILGININAPALAIGKCSDIVVSSHFLFSPLKPAFNRAIVDLYINGTHIETLTVEAPSLNMQNYAKATYIGRSAEGSNPFSGSLSKPFILNERIVPNDKAGKISNDISELPSLCR